jgi:hypothetical protein
MALPASPNLISMDLIRAELGLPTQAPFNINDARLGNYVPLNSCSTNKPPTSGAVSLASWYGYNHAATCSCAVTYTMNLPATGNWTNGEATTTIPIPLGSIGNVDITVSFTIYVQSSLGAVQFFVEYWNGSSWVIMNMYGSSAFFTNTYSPGSTSVTLNLKAGTYPGYTTLRVVGQVAGVSDPPNYNPVVYFTSAPTVYVACTTLETCGSTTSDLKTTLLNHIDHGAVRWVSLGGYVTGNVSVDWSFVRESGYVSNGFRMKIWYNGSFIADTGDITSSSDTPQTGTLTFSVNGADNKYAVVYYDHLGY